MSTIQELLQPHIAEIQSRLATDPNFQASARDNNCTFSIVSSEKPDHAIVIQVRSGEVSLSTGSSSDGSFGLQAQPEHWQAFFAKKLIRPYQSFWGMLRVISSAGGVEVIGDQAQFGRYCRIWRLVLDRARDAVHGKPETEAAAFAPPGDEVLEEDTVIGRYLWLDLPSFGKVKLFYDFAGTGSWTILFLHTAGSDSRQYHSLMNIPALQQRAKMYAFDLPAHGRSSLGSRQHPEGYALTEEAYLEVIGAFIKRLDLQNVIVCGASMAGHVCLAAAIRARELGIRGSIPCEACEHLPFTQPIYEIGGADTSLLDPERVTGMCAPTSPEYFKRQIWWQYSSQGHGVFSGDLKFYFRGWDGRGRVQKIDTAYCPVYMLTGEYDYSCTTEASRATAEKIRGAKLEAMEGLGHFPLTENPRKVLPYLMRALDLIESQHGSR